MAFTVSITPTNPTSILAGETVHFVATPSGNDGAVTYQWQELIGAVWTDISGETSSTLDRGPEGVGTDKIKVKATDQAETVESDPTWIVAASVYSTLSAVPTKLDTLHTDLSKIVKAVE